MGSLFSRRLYLPRSIHPSFELIPPFDVDTAFSSFGASAPTVQSRASAAVYDQVSGGIKLITSVGNNVMRLAKRAVTGGTFQGILIEPEAINLFPEGEDLSGWTATRCTITDGETDLLGGTDADMLHETVTTGYHGASTLAGTHPTVVNGTTYSMSVFAAPVGRSWARMYGGAALPIGCYFDVATGAVGTTSGGAVGYIDGLHDGGFYRIVMVGDATNSIPTQVTASFHTGDNVFSFAGTDIDSMIMWGFMLEAGIHATSYARSVGGVATRLADELRFDGVGNISSSGVYSFEIPFLIPNCRGITLPQERTLLSVSDGGAATDCLVVQVGTNRQISITSAATAGNAGSCAPSGAVDVCDGEPHILHGTLGPNLLTCWLDGVRGSTDTSVDPPTGQDRIDMGQLHDGTLQLNGAMRLKVYPFSLLDPVRAGGSRITL